MHRVLDTVLAPERKVAPGVIVFSCLPRPARFLWRLLVGKEWRPDPEEEPFSSVERCLLPRAGYFYPRCGCRGGWGRVTGQGDVADGPNRFRKPRTS